MNVTRWLAPIVLVAITSCGGTGTKIYAAGVGLVKDGSLELTSTQ